MKKKIDKTVVIAWLYLLGMLAFVNIMAFTSATFSIKQIMFMDLVAVVILPAVSVAVYCIYRKIHPKNN